MVGWVLLSVSLGNVQSKCIILIFLPFFSVALVTLVAYILCYLLQLDRTITDMERHMASKIVETGVQIW